MWDDEILAGTRLSYVNPRALGSTSCHLQSLDNTDNVQSASPNSGRFTDSHCSSSP
jgi:hypothetical protein